MAKALVAPLLRWAAGVEGHPVAVFGAPPRGKGEGFMEGVAGSEHDAPEQASVAASVRFNRTLFARTGILSLLLLWPLFFFGQMAVFEDTVSYLKAGRAAVGFIEAKLHFGHTPNYVGANNVVLKAPPPTSVDGKTVKTNVPGEEIKAGRSASYSIFAYLLRGPGYRMFALAVTQSILTAFLVVCLIGAYGSISERKFLLVALLLAFVTPLAFEANFVMPDIFAGLMLGALLLLSTEDRSLSGPIKTALILLAGFGFASHAGNPPLAAAVVMAGALWIWRWSKENRIRRLALLAAPLFLGAAVTLLQGFVAFHEVGLGAGRYPLTLARSIDNGPGKLYLDKYCPTKHYTVCEIFDNKVPPTIEDFLWSEKGLRYRASAAQMRRIRAEEGEIVFHAALEHPIDQFGQLAYDVPRQIATFGLRVLHFDLRVAVTRDEVPFLERVAKPIGLGEILANLSMVAVLASLVVVATEFKRWTPKQRAVILLIAYGLFVNAFVSALFSGVSGRYQSRLIWLLPLAVALFATFEPLQRMRGRTPRPADAPQKI